MHPFLSATSIVALRIYICFIKQMEDIKMNYSVIRRREIKRERLPIKHLERLFRNTNIDIALLAKFQSELDLEVVEVRTANRRIIYE